MKFSVRLEPGDLLAKRAARKAGRAALIVSVGIFLLLAALSAGMFRQARIFEARAASLSGQAAKWRQEVKAIHDGPAWKPLRVQSAVLTEVLGSGPVRAGGMLAAVEKSLPDGVSLREIRFSRKEGTVVIDGFSAGFAGGETLCKALGSGMSGMSYVVEQNRYAQGERVYAFRLRGSREGKRR
ncbi:MAG: hypothetical protein ACYDAX_03615 [Desulfobacteria bacterium]